MPPSDGALWLRAGFAFFRADALRWLAITAAFLFTLQVCVLIPGAIILWMLFKPVLTVGFLAAAWHQERGQRPEVKHLGAGFKSNLKALIPLGLMFLAGAALASALATSVSGVAMDHAITQADLADPVMLAKLRSLLVWTTLFMLPITFALWFAPALVVFDDASLGTAMKKSLSACAQNIGALIVFALCLMASFGLLIFLAMSLALVSKGLGTGFMLGVSMPFAGVVMIADYISYRRVFHPGQPLRIPA
jgi:hypothetical protein